MDPRSESSPNSTAMWLTLIASCCLLAYCYRGYSVRRNCHRLLPLPPGPLPLPLIGNLVDIPKVLPWMKYRELSKTYGNIISLQAMGRYIIVLNDAELGVELLEKRSAKYSSRPKSVVASLCGWDWNFSLMPYGQRWRSHRRLFWQHFHPSIVSKYETFQVDGARQLLGRLLTSHESVSDSVRQSLGATLLKITYGLDVEASNDRYLTAFEQAITSLDLLVAGAILLEFFPILARIPTWLPGTALLRRIASYRTVVASVRELPWADAKQRDSINEAQRPQSIASSSVENLSHIEGKDAIAQEDVCKSTLALVYAAAIDTTQATLCAFLCAMALYPEVQARAREELRSVVGLGRLPEISDRDKLPYINAVVKESLRWHVVTPMGVPHVSIADDEYRGYHIPKGSIVMVNAWSILHDPEMYPEPERFKPERFLKDGKLNPDVRDPGTVAFGFGRRICPGRYFADRTLFIYISSILHTLEIALPLDSNGQPVRYEPRASNELVSRLEGCDCTVRPQSVLSETLINGLLPATSTSA